jgi:site-specific recombinase XerD
MLALIGMSWTGRKRGVIVRLRQGTRLLANGASLEQIQLLLGHGDIDQTSRYIDVSLADMARAMSAVI